MMGYVWGMPINGMQGLPGTVDPGQRVEIVFRNTILVTPGATVKVIFDADNPGLWAFHCHNLYHMAAGMFSTLAYRCFASNQE